MSLLGSGEFPWPTFVAGCTLPGLLITWGATFLLRRWAPRWGLVDRPGGRKGHAAATPTGGGLAIWAGVVAPAALGGLLVTLVAAGRLGPEALPSFVGPHVAGLADQLPRLAALLAGGTVLLALGLCDDLRGLDWRLRLGVQVVVALLLVRAGWRLTAFLDVPWLTDLLSVLWIVGLVNSFNMLDNMDGLSAGVAAIAAAILAAVLLRSPDPTGGGPQLFVAGFLLMLVGPLLGFLWHNHDPARIFMGDAGSYFVGFCVAMATLAATFAGGDLPRHAILAPLCVLAIPIYDTLSVLSIRIGQGRSPFEGDTSHFSHRLVQLGLTPRHAVWTIYLATLTCGLGALLLHQVDATGAVVILLLVTCVLAIIAILEMAARK